MVELYDCGVHQAFVARWSDISLSLFPREGEKKKKKTENIEQGNSLGIKVPSKPIHFLSLAIQYSTWVSAFIHASLQ